MENQTIWDFLRAMKSDGTGLIILGPRGSGKTTLLLHVMMTYATNRQWRRLMRAQVPVLISLRQHAQRLISSPTLTILKARRFFLLKSAIEQLMRANGERKNDVLGRKRFWADILLVALSSTEADAQAATFWKRPFVTDPMIREYWHYLHQYYRLSALRLEGRLPPFECIWLARERA